MGVNKIKIGSTELINLTDTTAVQSDVSVGKYFYDANGDRLQGTNSGGGTTPDEYCIDGSLAANTCTTYKMNSTPISIYQYAFYYKTNLVTLQGSDNVQSLGANAFYQCQRLKNVSFPVLTTIGNSSVFTYSGLETIDQNNFPALTHVNGSSVFSYCRSLTRVDLPNTIFGNSTTSTANATIFQYCDVLEYADVSGSTYIPDRMFKGCSALTNIIVKNGVEVHSGATGTTNQSKFATINGITYLCTGTTTITIYRATDTGTAIATLSTSSTEVTVDGVTFKRLGSGRFKVTW